MITEEQLEKFELLKKKVEVTFQQQVLSCHESIHEWKGKQIQQFQEALRNTVGGYVSEKWFYTHLKVSKNKKLPRIDMLNLLAQYVGEKSWDDFLVPPENSTVQVLPNVQANKPINIKWLLLFVGILFLILSSFIFLFNTTSMYRFCIVDKDDGTAIDYKAIEAFLIKDNESPLELTVDSLGCVLVPYEDQANVTIKIQALYYHPTTIKRQITEQQEESIQLRKDDYALMIHYFSTNKMNDWNKRRAQLNLMLSDDARIIQVHDQTGHGMALYNKEEFINKMTLPIKSLKDFIVLETKYEGTQIIEIRFVQIHL